MSDLKISVDIGDGLNLSATWGRMTALRIYNRLLAGMPENKEWTTTQRRLLALNVFRRRFTLRLGDLVDELYDNWSHWKRMPVNYINVDCCCECIEVLFKHVEKAGKPAELDSWYPTTTRGRNVVGDADRIVRRFLDPGFHKPSECRRRGRPAKPSTNCRIHADKPATYSNNMCSTCYQRYSRLRSIDVLKADTAPVLIDAVLRLSVCRGRYSTLIEDARRLVTEYEN